MPMLTNAKMIGVALVLALIFNAALTLEGQRRRSTPEERKAETLQDVLTELNRLSAMPNLSQENRFLHERVSSLLELSGEAPADSDLLDRLESAMDDLLDASEHILDLSTDRLGRNETAEEIRRRTARQLEQTYFRIQHGDYFAGQSQESNGSEYVLTARRLYQLARTAYDAEDYRRARTVAAASREVIDALESLARAAVPIPDPPRLPEG